MSNTDLEWFREHVLLHAVGLLSPSDEERFLALAKDDEDCSELADAFANADHDDQSMAHHLPPDIIARWSQAESRLRGLERQMVFQHLSGCLECREDLAFLGYEVDLAAEAWPRERRRTSRFRFKELMQALVLAIPRPVRWTGVAVATSLILVVALMPDDRGAMLELVAAPSDGMPSVRLEDHRTTPGSRRGIEAPARGSGRATDRPSRGSGRDSVPPVVRRHSGSGSGVLTIGANATRVILDLPPPAALPTVGGTMSPEEMTVRVEVIGPAGAAHGLGPVPFPDFLSRRVVLGNGVEPIAAGSYRVVVTVAGGGRREVRAYEFRITRAPE